MNQNSESVSVNTIIYKSNADTEMENAKKLDQEGNFEQALKLYSHATEAYVEILDSFMNFESLSESENIVVEEISSKLTSISNRVDELKSIMLVNAFPSTSFQTTNNNSDINIASFPSINNDVLENKNNPFINNSSNNINNLVQECNNNNNFVNQQSMNQINSDANNPFINTNNSNLNQCDQPYLNNPYTEDNVTINHSHAFPNAPSYNVYSNVANNTINNNINNSPFILVLNIEKVICWQIDSTTSARTIIGDGKYPLKVYQREAELKITMYPDISMILTIDTPCLELTERHYIFSINNLNQMFAFVFDSNIPEIYLTLFENILIPCCNFRKKEKETQTIKLNNNAIVEEPEEDGIQITTQTKIDIDTEQITIEKTDGTIQVSERGEIVPFQETKLVITKEHLDIVAEKVEIGGKMITHGILQGGSFIQDGIQYCGNKIREKVDVGYVEVPDVLKKSLSYTREVTPIVSTLSGVVTGTVSGVASKIGTFIGNAAYSAVTSSSESEKESDQDSFMGKFKSVVNDPRTQSTINIGKHGVNAILNVFDALEEAGLGILDATGSATSNVVEKRFGSDMAGMISDSVAITSDVLKTTSNIKGMGAKNLFKSNVKTVAKTSAVSLLEKVSVSDNGVPLLTNDVSSNNNTDIIIINNSNNNSSNQLMYQERDSAEDELLMFSQMETTTEEGFVLIEDSEEFISDNHAQNSPRK